MRYKEKKDVGDKEKKAYFYFIDKGLSPIQASALVGNFIVESGLNTTIEGDKNLETPSVGIAQWRESRLDTLRRKYDDPYSFDNQLDFVWWELNNTHKRAFNELKQAETPEDAAIVVRKRYEVAWDGHDDRRVKQSLNVYNKFAPQEQQTKEIESPQIREATTQTIDNTYYYTPNIPKKYKHTLPEIEDKEIKEVQQVKEEIKQQQNQQDFLKEIMRLSQAQYVDPGHGMQNQQEDYYKKGGQYKYQTGGSFLSKLNPKNWGVEDYTEQGEFSSAYKKAKLDGEKEFMWQGERYSTDYAGTPRQEVGSYGVDGRRVSPQDLENTAQVNVYDKFYKSEKGKTRYIPGHIEAQVKDGNNEDVSVNYDSFGNMNFGIDLRKEKNKETYNVYGVDREKFKEVSDKLPQFNSDWNLLTNNCADNVCDSFGIDRSKGLETPKNTLKKISKKYPTLRITGRTVEDYENFSDSIYNADSKEVLDNYKKIINIYYSPDTNPELKRDLAKTLQFALSDEGFVEEGETEGNKFFDGIIGDKTLTALEKWKKKQKK